MFEFDPFEVGNPETLGYAEEELYDELSSLAAYSHVGVVSANDVADVLERYCASYDMLPQYLRAEIDNIEVC